jgi:hypothetical protein
MNEVGLLVTRRRAALRALVAGVLMAGLVGGWLAGSVLTARSSTPAGHVLATEGTIIVEN